MFQQTIILGRLVADPELKYLQNGTAITKFNMVTSRKYFDTDSQEWKENAEYHKVTAFGKTAQNICNFCKKGHKLYVVGRNKTSSFEKTVEGVTQKHWSTEVIIDNFQLLENKPKSEQSEENSEQKPKSSNKPKSNQKQKAKQPDPPADDMPPDSYSDEPIDDQGGSDDIPF